MAVRVKDYKAACEDAYYVLNQVISELNQQIKLLETARADAEEAAKKYGFEGNAFFMVGYLTTNNERRVRDMKNILARLKEVCAEVGGVM
ncbi:MAG: hypothetical protein H5U03_00125 [Clostridia bacterium]|nr:hypothetical protein [Clostridia bacterium]